MSGARGIRRSFGCSPKKGTKIRQILLRTLRPEGLTPYEAYREGWVRSQSALTSLVEMLRDQKGWDVRVFPLAKDDPRRSIVHGRGRGVGGLTSERPGSWTVLRCVGRMRWDGSYRSFVDPRQNRGRLSRQD
jgi:hypothetical protein